MTPRFALRQRPDAAFETLYRRHVHEVYRYTLAVLGNPADAEDVTQTTFMNAYRAFHDGERPRKPAHWLRAIAHNVCRQRFRQAARRPHVVGELDEADAAVGVDDEDLGPSAADITRALQSLPFNQRSALVMRELEGRRQAEIAEALDMSESAVEALLFRARRAMREQLETSITCGEAARAISRQLDRSLSREERASLRAHLRSCEECATFARQARAQRGALKALGAAPLPVALLSWGGGAGASGGVVAAAATAAGGGSSAAAATAGGASFAAIGLKVAAGVVAVAVVAGGGEAVLHATRGSDASGHRSAAATQTAGPPATRSHVRFTPRVARSGPAGHAHRAATHAGHGSQGTGRPASPARPGKHPHGAVVTSAHPTLAPVRAHGTPVRAHGTPAVSHGNAVRAHGSPPASHGNPVRAHGSPVRAHGTPGQSSATPTRAHGAPPQHQAANGPPPDKPPKK
jgi:RNA polymerase sigma factor (sigma-70 family)